MGIDLPLIWVADHRLRADDVCGDGWLRPGDRHPVPVRAATGTTATSWSTPSPRCGTATRPGWSSAAPALMAAFPLAYSVLLSALYLPLVLMLMGLILRGVAFEFRFKADEAHRPFWDMAFAGGSYVATFFQGAALGAFIDGFTVTGPSYDGGALDWLRPFSVFTGAGRDRRLCPAGQHMADDEDRGRAAAPHDRCRPPHRAGAADRDHHRQHLDAAGAQRHRAPLVRRARLLLSSRRFRSWCWRQAG